MSDNKLNIEIFSAPGCNKCSKAFQLAETVLADLESSTIELRLVNIVEELDYAVELGIRATPGIVINGVLVFTATPTKEALHESIVSRLSTKNQGPL